MSLLSVFGLNNIISLNNNSETEQIHLVITEYLVDKWKMSFLRYRSLVLDVRGKKK